MINRASTLIVSVKVACGVALMVAITLIPSCKKEQAISDIPAITFDSILPNPAIRYQDSIRIVISYLDGDGDLGQDSPAVKNLFVTDSRNDSVSQFQIPQLAPTGITTAIQGNLNIILPPQYFVNSNDTTETAIYSIYVVDRAGHKSNIVTTRPLVINW